LLLQFVKAHPEFVRFLSTSPGNHPSAASSA
jgi:hypothetical protein